MLFARVDIGVTEFPTKTAEKEEEEKWARDLRQKTGGACLYMPEDGHWLASFEVVPPQKLVFPRPKR